MDTWLSRGNAGAATLQLGGPDAYAPISQTLTAQNVSAPITEIATVAVAAGTAVITLEGYAGVAPPEVPEAVAVGMTVTNATSPSSILAGTTVLSKTSRSVTMSANAVGASIAAGDTIVFTTPNKAGADLIIAGSRGTGTGAGGAIRFKTAAAGGSGSNQNALADALVIDSAKTATFSGKTVLSNGAVNAPSLTFLGFYPGWGFFVQDAVTLGYTNGGQALWGLSAEGPLVSTYAAGLQWTSGVLTAAADLEISRNAAGVLEITNGTRTSTGGAGADLTLRNVVGQTGYHEMVETTAPSAPSADKVRIYAEDNGAGKTRLMALFSSGAAQQIAIEP